MPSLTMSSIATPKPLSCLPLSHPASCRFSFCYIKPLLTAALPPCLPSGVHSEHHTLSELLNSNPWLSVSLEFIYDIPIRSISLSPGAMRLTLNSLATTHSEVDGNEGKILQSSDIHSLN
ncbi:hypothetical protein AMECASPLE_009531 [Ameca splendens]|uniref:Uncharacterized protein n=1 Tax=Ameca splendens TaxID=208324 RepID=A0ABV0YY59_9TELE